MVRRVHLTSEARGAFQICLAADAGATNADFTDSAFRIAQPLYSRRQLRPLVVVSASRSVQLRWQADPDRRAARLEDRKRRGSIRLAPSRCPRATADVVWASYPCVERRRRRGPKGRRKATADRTPRIHAANRRECRGQPVRWLPRRVAVREPPSRRAGRALEHVRKVLTRLDRVRSGY
jgi:hypothetical protein